jgi:hypothetical protein
VLLFLGVYESLGSKFVQFMAVLRCRIFRVILVYLYIRRFDESTIMQIIEQGHPSVRFSNPTGTNTFSSTPTHRFKALDRQHPPRL